VSVSIIFSETVIVTGSPRIQLAGLTSKFATYASGSGTATLVFSYTVEAGDTDADGLAITANTLELNSGTIKDAANNNVTLTHSAITASASHLVDTTAPTVTLAASAATSTSATITFTVTGNEAITCSTLSTTSGTDFTYTNISALTGIVQTSSTVCTVTATWARQ
jgi:hypothetical protein